MDVYVDKCLRLYKALPLIVRDNAKNQHCINSAIQLSEGWIIKVAELVNCVESQALTPALPPPPLLLQRVNTSIGRVPSVTGERPELPPTPTQHGRKRRALRHTNTGCLPKTPTPSTNTAVLIYSVRGHWR